MPGFERHDDPDRPGQLLLRHGEPVAHVYWAHDFLQREQTGWFLTVLDERGEPDGRRPMRLAVTGEVASLIADKELGRTDWLARAEAVELVSAAAALAAGERVLEWKLGG